MGRAVEQETGGVEETRELFPNANEETIMDMNIGNDNTMLPLPQLDGNVTPQTSMA